MSDVEGFWPVCEKCKKQRAEAFEEAVRDLDEAVATLGAEQGIRMAKKAWRDQIKEARGE